MPQRKIAFRAWDAKLKAMFYAGNTHTHSLTSIRFTVNGNVMTTEERPGWSTSSLVPEQKSLMQFTGLHDKNGKEIWEGDVVLYPDTYTERVDVGVGMMPVSRTTENSFYPVEFRDGCFGMDVTGDSETLTEGWNTIEQVRQECDALEVIGNIYSDPHLLKGNDV